AWFIEDAWKITPRFELRAGFRGESTNGWNEAQGRAANYAIVDGVLQTNPVVGTAALTTNRAKFLPNPRLGFGWDVFGNGKTAVRGGAGLYHGLLDSLDYRLDQTAPFNTSASLKNVPVASLHIAPGTPLPSGSLVSPSNVQPDIATPAVITWSLRVEQQVAPATTLTLGYVGSHSYHQILSEDMNEPVPQYTASGELFYPAGSKNANPELANSTSWVSEGVGLYNALQVDVRRNFANSFQLRGNYTWSKNLDDGSAWNTSVSGNTPAYVEFPLNPKLDWGPSATDVRQQATVNGSWEVPFGPNHRWLSHPVRLARIGAAGWTLSGIVTAQTGFPFSPQLGYNPTGNGDTRNPVRPDWNPAFHGRLYPRTATEYFDPRAFLPPAAGTYGNVRRDSLTGPGLSQVDVSVLKDTAIREGVRLQLRAEFFNLLNHTNFLTPNEVVYTSATSGISPTAGVVTATSTTSRQVQLGAKVVF
ncbi:MAG TPA: carboxypeptidase regulatory-like domain-containing protein, partial [Acidobacteriaceae bacterium]|nr:carboxypeptidase regulatory-like domain-containing protein [Acidobacteriaceae bacterium]